MNQLKVIEKNNQRVLTSAHIAEVFGTDFKRINYNFNYNKERYEEGKHYFVLTGEERKNFVYEHEIHASLKTAHTIYLWTEKGAFLHAKSLNTDQAWGAYTKLVDDYFKKVEEAKQPQTDLSALSPQLQFMIMMEQKQNEIEKKQIVIEQKQITLEHRIDNFDKIDVNGDPQQRFNKMIRKFAAQSGITFQKAYREFKGNFNTAYRTNITSLHEHYILKTGKKISLPQYFTETNQIEDAIRVADKMLNGQVTA